MKKQALTRAKEIKPNYLDGVDYDSEGSNEPTQIGVFGESRKRNSGISKHKEEGKYMSASEKIEKSQLGLDRVGVFYYAKLRAGRTLDNEIVSEIGKCVSRNEDRILSDSPNIESEALLDRFFPK